MKLMNDIEVLSEEDLQLKSELEMLVERLKVNISLHPGRGNLLTFWTLGAKHRAVSACS